MPPTLSDAEPSRHIDTYLDHAWQVVSEQLPATPLLDSKALDCGVHLKLETWQPTGSFKVRGALAALAMLDGSQGVVTASTGNHALGTAFAASRLGVRATVVVPTTTSSAKLDALKRFPARLVMHGENYETAVRHASALANAEMRYLSAYNDWSVIAGQATIGVEILGQLQGDVTVICSVGAGGLAAGLGLTASRSGRMRVIGVEVDASQGVSAAIRAGRVVDVAVGQTLADGLAGNPEPGSITPDLVRQHVDSIVSVTDEQIREAIRYLAREHGLIAEGAGAAPLAAIRCGRVELDKNTVAVIGGRNIAMDTLSEVLNS